MKKTLHRTLAAFLVLVLVCTLLPQTMITAQAEDGGEKLSFDMFTAAADKEQFEEGPIAEAPFFSVVGHVVKRINKSKGTVKALEIEKACQGAVSFTLTAQADVVIEMSSTGKDNTSLVALYDANDQPVANQEGLTEVSTTDKTTLTYRLETGTYRIVSPASDVYNRGAFLYSVKVSQKAAAVQEQQYLFEHSLLTATGDKEQMAEGPITEVPFFSIVGKVVKRVNSDGSMKAVELEKKSQGGIKFTLSAPAKVVMEVASTGTNNVSEIALVDASNATVPNVEGLTEVVGSSPATTLNYTLDAGTYTLTSPSTGRGARVFSIKVTTQGDTDSRKPWDNVVRPSVSTIQQDGNALNVTVFMLIGQDGADSLTVTMLDESGNVLLTKISTTEGDERDVAFAPIASGTYVFRVVAKRTGEADKLSVEDTKAVFKLPLQAPSISLIHQGDNGALTAVWGQSEEATSYEVTCTAPDGTSRTEATSDRQYTFEGLTVGQTYRFTVAAIRGEERTDASAAVEATAAAQAKTDWNGSIYGPSTNAENNGHQVNEDGSVTVWSEGGKGKIVPDGVDGLSFYYTAVPTTHNFTLRAKVHVDKWSYSNGQEGFGLLVTDRLGHDGSSDNIWNNQYMLGTGKIIYMWDADREKAFPSSHPSGTKYDMKLGLGVISKTGLTPNALGYGGAMPAGFVSESRTMEMEAGLTGQDKGAYNVIGNSDTTVANTLKELKDFILEIQKNNTGYFFTYYDEAGNILHREKTYEPDVLNKLDEDFVYVGFYAARNARATFHVEQFTTIACEDDAPAEERPKEQVETVVSILSSVVSQSVEYELHFKANVDGMAELLINDGYTDIKDIPVKAEEVNTIKVTLEKNEITKLTVRVKPDPDQDLGEGKELASLGSASAEVEVTHSTTFDSRENLYVSPNGYSNGDGSLKNPLDIQTAVNAAMPGQTIILLEGTYKLETNLKIARGINGTEQKRIRMIGDPNAESLPVLDFQKKSAGVVNGGNYWFFANFEVTNTADGQKGFQVSGNYNILQNIIAHHNGNTGIQISRYSGNDKTIDTWPAYNLILNCTSYANADSGHEDADGFAAKLTCGEGNVFDGCVAYNNADDGWDLYAKAETGSIGAVTIRNCVAYANGYLEDGTPSKGNGNGFKMGGEDFSGHHKLINSVAFNNRTKGIDSNSCPDIIVENSTSYNNGSYNVAFFTKNNSDTAFKATGIISFRDSSCADISIKENIKPLGTQNQKDIYNDTCYYWDGTASKNASGATLSEDIFLSLTFKRIVRKADGTIDMQQFLELSDKAPADAGARMSGTASTVVTVNNPDQPEVPVDPVEPTEPTDPSGTTAAPTQPTQATQPTLIGVTDPAQSSGTVVIVIVVVVGVAAIAAAVVLYLKKKK